MRRALRRQQRAGGFPAHLIRRADGYGFCLVWTRFMSSPGSDRHLPAFRPPQVYVTNTKLAVTLRVNDSARLPSVSRRDTTQGDVSLQDDNARSARMPADSSLLPCLTGISVSLRIPVHLIRSAEKLERGRIGTLAKSLVGEAR